MDEVPDLDAFVSHLDDQLLPPLVRSHRLGELDRSGRVRVSVGDRDEVGQAARGIGEEREDGVGVGRGREGRGGLERGFGRLLGEETLHLITSNPLSFGWPEKFCPVPGQ